MHEFHENKIWKKNCLMYNDNSMIKQSTVKPEILIYDILFVIAFKILPEF